MGSSTPREAGAYVGQLADHARRLQREAREALSRGDYTRASTLIGDAELLAEDVHGLVGDLERREIGTLSGVAAYDVRPEADPETRSFPPALPLPSRRLRLALAATIALGLVLTEC